MFWSAFLIGFSGAMMPGPVLTATIAEVLKRGFRAGPLIVWGHAILEITLLAAIVWGLGRWIERDIVKSLLGLGGGVLLIAMGAQMAWTAKRAVAKAMAATGNQAQSAKGPVLTGILTSVSNPYWSIWWATTGLYYASLSLQRGITGLASFYAGHILSDLTWYSLVAGAVAGGRKICPPGLYHALIVLCGLGLVALGAYFAASGAASLAAP